MPKEKVNDNVTKGWYAEVSWDPAESDRNGYVQLASVNRHSKLELPPELLDHGPNGEELWGEAEPFDGWRVTLDEAGISKLIKTLHKAKRQAFPSEAPRIVAATTKRGVDVDETREDSPLRSWSG